MEKIQDNNNNRKNDLEIDSKTTITATAVDIEGGSASTFVESSSHNDLEMGSEATNDTDTRVQFEQVRNHNPTDCSEYIGCIIFCVFGLVVSSGIILLIFGDGHNGSNGGYYGGYYGGGGGGSCFPAGENILLADLKSEVPIEKVLPGSLISKGGRVTAVMKLSKTHNEQLYRYNDSVFVTGSHLVEENGIMLPVQESSKKIRVQNFNPEFVYNLITSNHKVVINSTTFSDWEEDEPCVENWYLERKLLDRLNNGRFDDHIPQFLNSEMVTEGAFAPSTPILLKNGSSIPIQSLQPEEELAGSNTVPNRVFAVMQMWVPPETLIFSYKDLTVTEWTIVLDDDGFWRNVKFSNNTKPLGKAKNFGPWYQLWTTTHNIPVSNRSIFFADYHVLNENDPIFSEECGI